jgi:hypothetical protein
MLWSGELAWGPRAWGGLERGGDLPEGAPDPRARRRFAQGSVWPSSEAEIRPRGRPGWALDGPLRLLGSWAPPPHQVVIMRGVFYDFVGSFMFRYFSKMGFSPGHQRPSWLSLTPLTPLPPPLVSAEPPPSVMGVTAMMHPPNPNPNHRPRRFAAGALAAIPPRLLRASQPTAADPLFVWSAVSSSPRATRNP